MKNFSFFKNRRNNASGEIRVNQMAEILGARINPKSGYEKDICIYVKECPREFVPENTYMDIVDQTYFIPWLLEHPFVKVISLSRIAQEYISKILNRKDVILLPQHHCNYLRESRNREEVKTVGIIGSPECGSIYFGLVDRLKDIGLDIIVRRNPRRRSQVVDFYKSIDIQVAYRPQITEVDNNMLTSLKLVNASSFGVPTVAYPEKSYVDEFDGCFLPAYSEDDLFLNIKRLKEEPLLYAELLGKAKERTEKYHIENIVELYKQL